MKGFLTISLADNGIPKLSAIEGQLTIADMFLMLTFAQRNFTALLVQKEKQEAEDRERQAKAEAKFTVTSEAK